MSHKEDKGPLPPEPPAPPQEAHDLEPGVVPPSRPVSLSRRLASAVSSAGRGSSTLGQVRKFSLPLGVLLAFGVVFVLFSEILRPFILALVIVYLMAPLVKRVSANPKEGKKGLPRWLAVIMVYVTFLGIVTASLFLFIPKVAAELVTLGETLPKEVQSFRQNKLPELNARLQNALRVYLPRDESASKLQGMQAATAAASSLVHTHRRTAASHARALAEASHRVRLAAAPQLSTVYAGAPGFGEPVGVAVYAPQTLQELGRLSAEAYQGGRWVRSVPLRQPTFRMRPAKGGGFDFYLQGSTVEVEQTGESTWRVSAPRELTSPFEAEVSEAKSGEMKIQEALDLERNLDKLIASMAKSSNESISSLVRLIQTFFAAAIAAFVAMILTLMVAAFMTIDLDAVMHFFRNLVPADHRSQYDELLRELDRGLSGVVRGQLMICLINGILTYIGLFFLDLKFSLLLAIVAGVLSLIPIFGTILSTVPIVLFGLMNSFMTGVFALLWILGIHFVEANILNPKIIGTSAHIHPVIVIFALLAGESAFGLFGALLAVPTASILLTLFMFLVMRTRRGERAAVQLHDETEL